MAKISVSFSGGRSSAAMVWIVLNSSRYADYEKQFIFANTGQEHPATLDFVNECDKRWGLNIVWLEANIDARHKKGTGFNVVSYETATRDCSLFEQGCQKYGLPNVTWKWCTRELKIVPMNKYRKYSGFDDAFTAIGIRADEIDRMSDNKSIVYPLIEMGWTKSTVNNFWENQDFDLKIPNDAYGNCVWCYKKSFRKLATVAKYNPEFFETPKYLESKYAKNGSRGKNDVNDRFIFRNQNNTDYILSLSKDPLLNEYQELYKQLSFLDLIKMNDLDIGGDCDQGCEII